MSKDRKDIYLGDGLRRAIKGRKESLSTVVNLIADRYQGLMDREWPVDLTPVQAQVYRAVLTEARGHLLEAREIAAFTSMVSDWLSRHPEVESRASIYDRVECMTYSEKVALIDKLERQP